MRVVNILVLPLKVNRGIAERFGYGLCVLLFCSTRYICTYGFWIALAFHHAVNDYLRLKKTPS